MVDSQIKRIGSERLEGPLIGTIAHCKLCRPSSNWLGGHSPKKKIRESGLWLIQHLDANVIANDDEEIILNVIRRTKEWIAKVR